MFPLGPVRRKGLFVILTDAPCGLDAALQTVLRQFDHGVELSATDHACDAAAVVVVVQLIHRLIDGAPVVLFDHVEGQGREQGDHSGGPQGCDCPATGPPWKESTRRK
jgi:hypothetical protein